MWWRVKPPKPKPTTKTVYYLFWDKNENDFISTSVFFPPVNPLVVIKKIVKIDRLSFPELKVIPSNGCKQTVW